MKRPLRNRFGSEKFQIYNGCFSGFISCRTPQGGESGRGSVTEMISGEHFDNRTKPLPWTSGYCTTATHERTFVTGGHWPLHLTAMRW